MVQELCLTFILVYVYEALILMLVYTFVNIFTGRHFPCRTFKGALRCAKLGQLVARFYIAAFIFSPSLSKACQSTANQQVPINMPIKIMFCHICTT